MPSKSPGRRVADILGAIDRIASYVQDITPKERTALGTNAADVRRIRSGTRMSQPIFAVMDGVGASTVAQWEQGAKKPGGASARLLGVIDRKGIDAIA